MSKLWMTAPPTAVNPATQTALDAKAADLPESASSARTTADGTPNNLLNKLTRYDTTGGAINQPLPAATTGRTFAIGWDAGTAALTLTAAGSDVIGSGAATSFVVPLPGEVLTLHCTTAGRWRVVSGFKPQSALDARFLAADVIASRATGVAATDQANLAAAVAACPAGGLLLLPGGGTLYQLNAPLVITKSMTIEGASLSDTFLPTTGGGALNRPNAPYVSGSVLQQTTAGADVLQLSGSAISVHLRKLGLTWASAIRDTNTGHGINATPSTTSGSGHDTGLASFSIRNVTVAGHDGSHYALLLVNELYGTVDQFRSYGGGGISVVCDSYVGNFGNLVMSDTYINLTNAGSADGYRLAGRVARGGTAGVLNLIVVIRPQCNITLAANTQGTQAAWNSNAGTALPANVRLIEPDLEVSPNSSTCPIDFGGVNSGTVVVGGLITKAPTGGFTSDRGYQMFTASGSFVVPSGVYKLRTRAFGGGGGGGGGGSALTSGGVSNQAGGGGGGAGMATEQVVDVVPSQTCTVTIGAAGTAGTGGAANGSAGTAGGQGGQTSLDALIRAQGGGGGGAGPANANTSAGGGNFGSSGTVTTVGIPGTGGPSQSPNGNTSRPMPPGIVGGSAGGAATATLGGGAGGAATTAFLAGVAQGGGSGGASGTTGGVAGTAAVAAGCGGGGGGGGAPGGAGANGGAGAAGSLEIWW